MEDSNPEDSCVRFWGDSSLDFSYCLDGEFSDISESSTHLAPNFPLASSFEEVGPPVLELDELVLQKSEEENLTECCYKVYDENLNNSETPDVLMPNNAEYIDSYLDWDEKSLAVFPEPTRSPVDQSVCTFCQLLRAIIHTDGKQVLTSGNFGQV